MSPNAMFDYAERYGLSEVHVVVKEKAPVNSDEGDSVTASADDDRRCVACDCSAVCGAVIRESLAEGEFVLVDVVPACDGTSAACVLGAEYESSVVDVSKTCGCYNRENVSVVVVRVSYSGVLDEVSVCGSVDPNFTEYCTEFRGIYVGAYPANDLKVINIDLAEKVSIVPGVGLTAATSGGYDKTIDSVNSVVVARGIRCVVARPGVVGECTVCLAEEVCKVMGLVA